MSLFVASLNSGSNGNCYYVGNEQEAVLIDAGISCRETEKRMKRLGLEMQKVKAVFISHEHTDHIHGLCVLAKKYQMPVYITERTFSGSRLDLSQCSVYPFLPYVSVAIGNMAITAFPKVHDAADPHSFVIDHEKVRIGVFTDIGSVCEHVIQNFKTCHAVFLEANYDEDMLENGRYPYFLKNRIRGGKGHISNKEAMALFSAHRSAHLSHLFLSHLSRDNNDPTLVQSLFQSIAGETKIVVASRYEETAVYAIRPDGRYLPASSATFPLQMKKPVKMAKAVKDECQLSLF